MCHNATQFIFARLLKGAGIVGNAIDTDENFTGNRPFGGVVLKRDDVGKCVVVEELLIHFEQLLVGNKDVVQLSDLLLMRSSNALEPGADLCFVA